MIQQLAANGLITGSVFAIVGTGFALTYMTSGFLNFAHAATVALGAYATLIFLESLGISQCGAIVLAVLFGVGVGCFTECIVYRPLKRRGSSELVLLVASLGVYAVFQNTISAFFGDDYRTIGINLVSEGHVVLGARMTPSQIATILTGLALSALCAILLGQTRIGRIVRAIAIDRELARVSGISCDDFSLSAMGISSGLGATAGILIALDIGMTPAMGVNPMMMGVVAVMAVGPRRIAGIYIVCVALGIAHHFAAYAIGSKWQDAAILAGLLLLMWTNNDRLAKRFALSNPE
jgi:branched-chain amino acid transport system permease protein